MWVAYQSIFELRQKDLSSYSRGSTLVCRPNTVAIPVITKCVHIVIYCIKEENMDKPEMGGILYIQVIRLLEPGEKGSPTASKLRTNFHP
jgi:hypothetical protein